MNSTLVPPRVQGHPDPKGHIDSPPCALHAHRSAVRYYRLRPMRPLPLLFVFASGGSAPNRPPTSRRPGASQTGRKPPRSPSRNRRRQPRDRRRQPAAAAAVAASRASRPRPTTSSAPTTCWRCCIWREKDMSVEVAVRPDGMITLPLLNEVKAAGLTPEQLRQQVEKAAAEYVEEPSVTVVVKQINSRQGVRHRQGGQGRGVPADSSTTVLQAIATAGGLNGVRRGRGHRRHADGGRQDADVQVQLQGRDQGQEAGAEHRAEARGHDFGAVGGLSFAV